jgi:hypothetical protein
VLKHAFNVFPKIWIGKVVVVVELCVLVLVVVDVVV